MNKENFDYEVIAYKGSVAHSSDNMGKLNVILQKSGGVWGEVDDSNFCKTKQIFVPSLFTTVPDKKLIRLKIKDNDRLSERENDCQFITVKVGDDKLSVEELKPKDVIQLIKHILPETEEKIIILKEQPFTKYILINCIEDSNHCFGPFEWKLETRTSEGYIVRLEWSDAKFIKILPKNFIYKITYSEIQDCIFESLDTSGVYYDFINNMSDEFNKLIKYFSVIDYSSYDELITYGVEQLKSVAQSNPSTLKSLQQNIRTNEFKKTLEQHIKHSKLSEHETTRLGKFLSYIAAPVSEELAILYSHDAIDNFVNQVIIESPEKYKLKTDGDFQITAEKKLKLENIQNNIDDAKLEFLKLSKDLNNLKMDKQKHDSLEDEIAKKAKKLQEIDQKYNEEEKKRVDSLEEKIKSKDNELNEISLKLNIANSIQKLREDKAYWDRNIDELKSQKKAIEEHLQKSNEALRTKLSDLKPYVDYINGTFIGSPVGEESVKVDCKDIIITDNTKIQIINTLRQELSLKKRYLQEWEVANLLICLQQSFITIFAGLPGTGKTSLSRLLPKSQGLGGRLKEVSVSRGWTSEKDLIGFYNPLTSSFQPSATGLYGFLKAISDESNETNNFDVAMSYILLDEANLSPMEHYWSKFMGMTDNDQQDEVPILSLGGNESLRIPSFLRFMATINYDGTTEVLSPRIIDRAPVLVLNNNYDEGNLLEIGNTIDKLPVSAKIMDDLFGRSGDALFIESEKKVFYELKHILNMVDSKLGLGISISPRKENSIKEYCEKARAIYFEHHELFALDLAFLQLVLPKIKGHGDFFIERIKLLQKKLVDNNLIYSGNHVTKMLEFAAAEFGSIDFFCW